MSDQNLTLKTLWWPGQKLTPELFTEDSRQKDERLRFALKKILLNDRFGLVSPDDEEKKLEINLDDPEKIIVRNSKAFNHNGEIIDISHLEYNVDLDSIRRNNSQEYWLAISFNGRKNVGDAVILENKKNYSYSVSNFNLELIELDSWNPTVDSIRKEAIFPLALLYLNHNGELKKHLYIPPCTNIEAHEELSNFHKNTSNTLKTILIQCESILRKTNRNTLHQNSISKIIYTITTFLNNSLDHYLMMNSEPPKELVIFFKKLARNYLSAFNQVEPTERIAFEDFIEKHTKINSLDQIQSVKKLLEKPYNHFQIHYFINVVGNFLKQINIILDVLKETEMTKIPESKNTEPFILNMEIEKL